MVDLEGSGQIRQRVVRGRRRLFERLVVRAVDQLPPEIHAMLDNVQIVVEDEPTAEQLDQREGTVAGASAPGHDQPELLGLYEGTPLTERSVADGFRLPDKITLFRGPLERATRNQAELSWQVQVTVVHEIAHHVGLDEDRIAELGWA
jgi:predicted Zn-dependent protease with MMP-like domain